MNLEDFERTGEYRFPRRVNTFWVPIAQSQERIKEKTFKQNPKIYYGILWLLTYGMHPGKLCMVTMKDFDQGRMHLIN